MDKKSLILCIFGAAFFIYTLITMQFLIGIICIILIAALWLIVEKVVPVLDTYFKNIQRLADDIEEIKNNLNSDKTGSRFQKQ